MKSTPRTIVDIHFYVMRKYKVSNNDRKRLMGHTFQDVTNDVYGHRELEELRKEIEKIPCHKCVANGKATQNQKSQEK